MNLSKIAVKRPVTTFMIILIFMAFGVLSIFNLNVDMMPNMNIPIAIVSTSYSGVGSEEIENLITKPLEEIMGTVAGMKTITSRTSYGSSIVIVEFEDSVDIDNAALDMREKIDLIKGFLPEDAKDPIVLKIDMNSMTNLTIGVTSQHMDMVELKHLVETKIEDRLTRQNGVAQVSISGGREKEVAVVLQPDKLRGFGISESMISQTFMAENRSIPTGTIKQGDQRLSLRVSGEFDSLEDIKNIPIKTATGATVYIKDIAEVSEVFKDVSSVSSINGSPSITITVQKQSTANTVNVSDSVIKELNRIKEEMPELSIKVLIDPAEYIRMSLSNVSNSAIYGAILAVVILFIFLRNVRSTLVIAAAIPVSIVITFAFMYYTNISLNMMSLGGLTLGIGMLVDNSIVVLESIYRKIEEGDDNITAAIEGAREVAISVIASTLTTIAVFLPISFAGGLVAQIFNQLSLTITFSLISSLLVSLTFVPMACSLFLKISVVQSKHSKTNVITNSLDFIGSLISRLESGYKSVLGKVLIKRKTTMAVTISLVILTGFSLGFLGFEFIPASDESAVSVSVEMPKGTLLAETEKTLLTIVDKFKDDPILKPYIKDINITAGAGGGMQFASQSSDIGSISISLVGKKERKLSSDQIARMISEKASDVPGAKISSKATASAMGPMAGAGLQMDIVGDDLDVMTQISKDMEEIIKKIPGVREVSNSIEGQSPQATIKINRDKAAAYGIAASSVSGVINTAVAGSVASTFKIEGTEYDIRIMQDKTSLDYISDIENILIPSPLGINVPLYEIADIQIEPMPTSINRKNQQRYITVSCGIFDRSTSEISNDITNAMKNYDMPGGYSWEFSGAMEQMKETFSGLGFALIVSLFLVYMIMAAEFESLIYPFIVLFSIPIALTGGMSGLIILGQNFSITAFLGMIMLVGVVINNAIVLIDYTNLLIRERNYSLLDALKKAGPVRLRPILMTTLTTVIALIPIMVSNGDGAELMRGLAVVVVFGLSLSTLVTLLFIPVVYVGMNNLKEKFDKVFKRNAVNN